MKSTLARRPRSGVDETVARDVRHYLSLTPRQLPSRLLYDGLGSALFDAICRLPWYPITRAERRLIRTHGREILRAAGDPPLLFELGAGNGSKLALLLGDGGRPRTVHLVDVSASALTTASRRLEQLPDVQVIAHRQRYEDGLAHLAERPGRERVLVLFLGSNLGNFDLAGAEQFLLAIRAHLCPGDAFLVGVDLVKPEERLLLAYDDPLGVTAAFNKNLLVRLNNELGADFALDRFVHRAVWNAVESRIEMHLESLAAQHVAVPDAGLLLDFAAGERIWTESSYKYEPASFRALLTRSGFAPAREWIDGPGQFLLQLSTAG